MDTLVMVAQIVIALGIANVWLIRPGKASPFRGGEAKTLEEEFAVYGLSPTMMRLIGSAKLLLAATLVVGIWVPVIVRTTAIAMAALMLGAVSMHVKVGDPPLRALPAFVMLALAAFVAIYV
jgi:hypothetical protein